MTETETTLSQASRKEKGNLYSLLSRMADFCKKGTKINEVTPALVEEFLSSLNVSEKTRKVNSSYLHVYFEKNNPNYKRETMKGSKRGRKPKTKEIEPLFKRNEELEESLEGHRKTIDDLIKQISDRDDTISQRDEEIKNLNQKLTQLKQYENLSQIQERLKVIGIADQRLCPDGNKFVPLKACLECQKFDGCSKYALFKTQTEAKVL